MLLDYFTSFVFGREDFQCECTKEKNSKYNIDIAEFFPEEEIEELVKPYDIER